jgi:hypothetical protein
MAMAELVALEIYREPSRATVAQEIGQFWFDTHDKTQIQECVVVGKGKEDTWFVLLVAAIGEKRYKRFGLGKVKPRYTVSRTLLPKGFLSKV